MTADRVVEIILGILSLIVGFSAYVFATRATSQQAKAAVTAVDAGAYERAKIIYESALETLRDELAATRSDLVSARNEILSLRGELATLRSQLNDLRNT